MRTKLLSFILLSIGYAFCFAQGYYKDLLIDNGAGLAGLTDMPAADSLLLSSEFISTDDSSFQNALLIGNEQDFNGVLLYPDGEPRFRMIYTNGGKAGKHIKSLRNRGERIKEFFINGGSYTGSCAGAFLACSTGTAGPYYNLWPGIALDTDLENTHTGHFIPGNSPLLQYFRFGNDLYIDNVYHNGGGYANGDNGSPAKTEVLLRYDYPSLTMHNKPSCWAYKENELSGRMVIIGSHPEFVTTGERLHLMEAMILYALDGTGSLKTKGNLGNGIERIMDKSSGDNDPDYTKIGDKQYHHFTVDIPWGTAQLKIAIKGETGFHLKLYARKDDYAFANTSGYSDTAEGQGKEILIPDPDAGTWFIGVECATTVETIKHSWGYEYTGNIEVLNGVSYNIQASWGENTNLVDQPAQSNIIHLSQNFPNPFNSSTTISFIIDKPSRVKLTIHDLQGRIVKTLVNTIQNPGKYSVVWNAMDDNSKCVPAGIYFYSIETDYGIHQQKKMIIIR